MEEADNTPRTGRMERIGAGIGQREQTCQCGQKYIANIIPMLSLDLSGGRCPECREKYRAEILKQEEAVLQAQLDHDRLRYRQTCGIQSHFMDKDFSNFDRKQTGNVGKVWSTCWDYAEVYPINNNPGRGYHSLLLTGDNGRGKTHLAVAIGHRILDRWQGEPHYRLVKFISEPDLLASIQATYSYSQEERQVRSSEDDIIKECIATPLLILDDVARERRKDMDFVRRTLFKLIDGRYTRERPMVLTTNQDDDGLRDYLSFPNESASHSRLYEMCQGKSIKLIGEDYRKKERP